MDPVNPNELMGEFLDFVKKIVTGKRQNDYGTPTQNHGCTARMWTAYMERKGLCVTLTAEDVCMFNILQKISRGAHSLNEDTLMDIAGYSANAASIQAEKAELTVTEKPLNGTIGKDFDVPLPVSPFQAGVTAHAERLNDLAAATREATS